MKWKLKTLNLKAILALAEAVTLTNAKVGVVSSTAGLVAAIHEGWEHIEIINHLDLTDWRFSLGCDWEAEQSAIVIPETLKSLRGNCPKSIPDHLVQKSSSLGNSIDRSQKANQCLLLFHHSSLSEIWIDVDIRPSTNSEPIWLDNLYMRTEYYRPFHSDSIYTSRSLWITNVTLEGNLGTASGEAALWVKQGHFFAEDCIFRNWLPSVRGVISVSSKATFRRCSFLENHSQRASVIAAGPSSSVLLQNCTFARNTLAHLSSFGGCGSPSLTPAESSDPSAAPAVSAPRPREISQGPIYPGTCDITDTPSSSDPPLIFSDRPSNVTCGCEDSMTTHPVSAAPAHLCDPPFSTSQEEEGKQLVHPLAMFADANASVLAATASLGSCRRGTLEPATVAAITVAMVFAACACAAVTWIVLRRELPTSRTPSPTAPTTDPPQPPNKASGSDTTESGRSSARAASQSPLLMRRLAYNLWTQDTLSTEQPAATPSQSPSTGEPLGAEPEHQSHDNSLELCQHVNLPSVPLTKLPPFTLAEIELHLDDLKEGPRSSKGRSLDALSQTTCRTSADHLHVVPSSNRTSFASTAVPPTRSSLSDSSRTCVICFDHIGDRVLLPCGHGGYCRRCTARLQARPECPFCRGSVSKIVKVPVDTRIGSAAHSHFVKGASSAPTPAQ